MDYFFVYDYNLPERAWMPRYGIGHICWLLAAVLLTVMLCRRYRSVNVRKARAMRIAVAAAICCCELFRTLALYSVGSYNVYSLPLHLCGISVFLTAWHSVRGDEYIGEFLFAVSMPGAVAALIFPDWLGYPALNLLSINSFLAHILLAAYPLMLIYRGGLTPQPRRLLRVTAVLAAIAVPVYVVNMLTGANFMYLSSPPPASPLLFFERYLGRPGYILGFIPILAVIWLALYPLLAANSLSRPNKGSIALWYEQIRKHKMK